MKYEYRNLEKKNRKVIVSSVTKHPMFGYIILAAVLIATQLSFMFGDGIVSLTLSKAISLTMIYAIAAMGLSILIGMAGLISLGTAAFIGLGAYIAGNILKAFILPYGFVLIAVMIVAVVIGIVVGFISLRATKVHLLIITMALAFLLNEFFSRPNSFTGGASGLTKVPFPELFAVFALNRETVYFVVLGVMLLIILVTINIINSPTGRAMMAMRNSESLAQAMGISILKYRILAFVIATEYAMIAGALYISSISSASAFSWNLQLSLNILAVVILGGHVKPISSILGAFIIFCLDLAVLKNITFFTKNSSASLIFSGILIILIIVKYPGGLMKFLDSISIGFKSLIVKRRVYKYGIDR